MAKTINDDHLRNVKLMWQWCDDGKDFERLE